MERCVPAYPIPNDYILKPNDPQKRCRLRPCGCNQTSLKLLSDYKAFWKVSTRTTVTELPYTVFSILIIFAIIIAI